MPKLTVRELIEEKRLSLQLDVLTGDRGLDRPITEPEIGSPGLALAGYMARFAAKRLYVLGETEIAFLRSLKPGDRVATVQAFFQHELPCVFITKGLSVPRGLLAVARERSIPVVRSKLKTAEFYSRITPFLQEAFAPRTTVHGSLADVYGVGLLFVGRSGIGKSECVLDLVERGHRLVADDVVHVSRRGADVLLGRGHELSHHFMEIRGVGLVDVKALFGIRSVRQQKRIEVVVELLEWDTTADVDRTGLDLRTTEILGVALPQVVVPLNPGKNITVISEVVAMSHLLRYSGYDAAKAFNERLLKQLGKQRELRDYLSEDYE
ncbi:MAG: HPr(Ser) kinase/phosphatase [Gemmatimonadota bacterium]|nr:HPr(Ser) kinase/phosphatase [Gemmatimonadota bacterium]